MTRLHYESAIYKINAQKGSGTRVCFDEYECEHLPKQMSILELAQLLSKMQKVCFKDQNVGHNTKRLVEIFKARSNKTFIVGISLGFPYNATQIHITEVCRAKLIQLNSKSYESPVSIVMKMVERYITRCASKTWKTIDGLYLYIEKNPKYGDADFLIGYYKKYGFNKMNMNDPDYFYMKKLL
jgi:hypothetical protein